MNPKNSNVEVDQTAVAALKILRRHKVEERTTLSRTTIYELVKSGQFPRPIALTKKSVGWLSHEIDDWLKRQITLRDSK